VGLLLAGALWALAATGAAAQGDAPPVGASAPAQDQDVRSALNAERAAQTQVLDAAERACYARFFTTNCLLDVARSRRAMQADIKQKEAALNAAERQQRAQEARLRVQEKQQQHSDPLDGIDPLAAEQAQGERRAAQETKQGEHAARGEAGKLIDPAPATVPLQASQAEAVLPANPPKAAKTQVGPSAQERAANQAAFDKKQAEAQRRIREREAERAKAAASGALPPPSLPLPLPAPSTQ
jgi:Skp family chaperone for outer membrane proteins